MTELAKSSLRPVYFINYRFRGWNLKEWTGNASYPATHNVYGDFAYSELNNSLLPEIENQYGPNYYSGDYFPAEFTITIPTVTESLNMTAESVIFELSASQDEIPVNLSDPYIYRNRQVDLFIGFADPSTHIVPVNTPYRLFTGNISEVNLIEDGEDDRWQVKVESKLIDLQQVKIARYTHQSQLELFSGDKGLEFASTAQAGLFLSRNETPDKPYSKNVVYGMAKVEGSVVFMATSGTGSRHLNLLVAFAGHECESIEQVYLDDRPLLNANGNVSGEFSGVVQYYERLGTDTQTYISQLATNVGSSIWTSAHQLKGICYAYLRILYSEDLFGTDAPKISAVIKGKKLYDPRTDTTAYSDNPALAVRDYLLNDVYGFSSGSARVDDSTISVAANDCDFLITKKDTNTEKRYTVNGFLSTENKIGKNLEELLACMAGKVSYLGGEFAVFAGTYALSNAVINEDMLIDTVNLTANSIRNAANGARGIYTSQDIDWKEDEYPLYQSATDLAEDGSQTRFIDLPLRLTKSAATAQRIAKINVKRTRCSRKLSLRTCMEELMIRTGDVISIESSKSEVDSGVYEVQSMAINNSTEPYIDLELLETKSTVYDWDASTEEKEVDVQPSVANSILSWSLARLSLPTASPASQSYTIAFNVTVSHNETGVTCRYTTDGTEPDSNDASIGNGGTISISGQTVTLKLKTFQNNGTLTSEVSTYEYTYVAPTNQVATPTYRWSWNFGYTSQGPSATRPFIRYQAPTQSGTVLKHSTNGGTSYTNLSTNTNTTSFYNTGVIQANTWTPSNYRAYRTKAGFIDSNQLIIPNQCIPPCLWKEVDQYGNYKIGMQAFGTNCSIYWRYATKSKYNPQLGWSEWSSYSYYTGFGWAGFMGTKYPNKDFDTSSFDYEYEVYVTQSGFQDSIVMYANSDTNQLKYGGENGTSLGSIPSKPDGYSD